MPRNVTAFILIAVILSVTIVFIGSAGIRKVEAAQGEYEIPGYKGKITIISPCEIGKPIISLGDIATFSGMARDMVEDLKSIEIGKAPSPGQTRTLSLAIVRVRLRQAGYDPDDIIIVSPVTISVKTRSTVVTCDEIVRAVEGFIRNNMPWNPEDTTITVLPVQDKTTVPDGDIEIQVEPLPSTKFLGTTSVKVEISVDGRVTRTLQVRVRLDVAKEIVVSTRTIQRNEIISPDDLTLSIYDLADVPQDVVFDSLLIDGMMAKHTIPAGRPVTFSNVQHPPVILRGDLVALEAVSGGVAVTIPGQALEAGSVGDLIRVKNTSSGVIVRAKVVDSQRVQGI